MSNIIKSIDCHFKWFEAFPTRCLLHRQKGINPIISKYYLILRQGQNNHTAFTDSNSIGIT